MARSLLIFTNSSIVQRPPPPPQSFRRHLTDRRRLTSRISTPTSGHRGLIRRAMEPSSGVSGGEPSEEIAKVANSSGGPAPSGGPRLPVPNIPTWAKWAVGCIICLAVPFYKRVLRIEDGVESAVETVVEAVEKVAGVAEKVAADIADALPDKSSVKEEVMEVEQFAEEVEEGAEKAEEFIHKVDEIKEKADEIVEHIIEEGEKFEKDNPDREKKGAGSSSNL